MHAKKIERIAAKSEFEKIFESASGLVSREPGVFLLKPSSLSSSGFGVFVLPSISNGVNVKAPSCLMVAFVSLIFSKPCGVLRLDLVMYEAIPG